MHKAHNLTEKFEIALQTFSADVFCSPNHRVLLSDLRISGLRLDFSGFWGLTSDHEMGVWVFLFGFFFVGYLVFVCVFLVDWFGLF